MPWVVAKALQAPYYTGKIKADKDRVWLAAMIDGEGTIGAFHHIRNDDGNPRTGVNINITIEPKICKNGRTKNCRNAAKIIMNPLINDPTSPAYWAGWKENTARHEITVTCANCHKTVTRIRKLPRRNIKYCSPKCCMLANSRQQKAKRRAKMLELKNG